MKLLRIIVVVFSCISFASAGFAAQMQCCMEEQSTAEAEMDMQQMPCHEMDMSQDSPDAPVTKKSCDCACVLHSVVMPKQELPVRFAQITRFSGVQPLPPLGFYPPIEAPPKAFS